MQVSPVSVSKTDFKSLDPIAQEDLIRFLDSNRVEIGDMASQIIAIEHMIHPNEKHVSNLLINADWSLDHLSISFAVVTVADEYGPLIRLNLKTILLPAIGRRDRMVITGTLSEWKREAIRFLSIIDTEHYLERQFLTLVLLHWFKPMKIMPIFDAFNQELEEDQTLRLTRKK